MKVYIHKIESKSNGDEYVFANEGKGGFVGSAPTVGEAMVKAREMYSLHCITTSMWQAKLKKDKDPEYKTQLEDFIIPEELEFIEL